MTWNLFILFRSSCALLSLRIANRRRFFLSILFPLSFFFRWWLCRVCSRERKIRGERRSQYLVFCQTWSTHNRATYRGNIIKSNPPSLSLFSPLDFKYFFLFRVRFKKSLCGTSSCVLMCKYRLCDYNFSSLTQRSERRYREEIHAIDLTCFVSSSVNVAGRSRRRQIIKFCSLSLAGVSVNL